MLQIKTETVKKIMEERGFSTTELAVKMAVKETFVYGILKGVHGKTFATVEKLASALGVEAKEILS